MLLLLCLGADCPWDRRINIPELKGAKSLDLFAVRSGATCAGYRLFLDYDCVWYFTLVIWRKTYMTAHGEMSMEQLSVDTLKVNLSGQWKLGGDLQGADQVRQRLQDSPGIRNVVFDTQQLAIWDTGLLTFLNNLRNFCSRQNIGLNSDGLPEGARKLLELASAVPETKDARPAEPRASFLVHLGEDAIHFFQSAGEMLAFIGDAAIAFSRLLRGKAQFLDG